MKAINAIVWAALLIGTLSAQTVMAQVNCGDTITQDTVLTGDLTCATYPALTVQGPAKLNLGGYTLSCQDTSYGGIDLRGSGATLVNGKIRGCDRGVRLLDEGSHRVWRVRAVGNAVTGIAVASDRNRVARSASINNRGDGFRIFNGDNNWLVSNRSKNNSDGMEIASDGTDDSTNNRLLSNYVVGNRAEGINVNTSDDNNKLIGNRLIANTADGIEINSSGNNVHFNLAKGNGAEGIDNDFGGGNTYFSNLAYKNDGNDLEDSSGNCENNKWIGNRAETKFPDCIN